MSDHSMRDAELARALRDADRSPQPTAAQLRALGGRIMDAAAPILEARAAAERTIWDYAERWSSVLLPVGAFTTLAASLCLFALVTHQQPNPSFAASPRVALMGAATNRVSSQHLLDLLVAADAADAADAAEPNPRGDDR